MYIVWLLFITYLPIRFVHVAPGAPVVLNAGPLLPADETNTIPCLSTASLNNSWTRLLDFYKHFINIFKNIFTQNLECDNLLHNSYL